jgi:enoyl-CoA hydratase/3-hydroxyacyl-CoA dehydrogenase
MDRCRKPIVAALNGMALGGGLEVAMRCHAMVATREAWMQFPEITLGIVPGIGGVAVPYRRWPGAAELFNGMLTRAERLTMEQAAGAGIVDALVAEQEQLIPAALELIGELKRQPRRDLDAPVRITAPAPDGAEPRDARGQLLSREALRLICDSIRDAAAATSFAAALEVGYQASGASACTAAAREGVTAFGEKRQPDYARTG